MKNKILDTIGFIVIIYGLSLAFVLLLILIFEGGVMIIDRATVFSISVLFIRPIPFMIAIYMYLGTKELKKDYEQSLAVFKADNNKLNGQVENYILLDDVRVQKIRKYEKEITELNIVIGNMIEKDIPFSDKPDSTEAIWFCKDCGVEMKRESSKMRFCDNPSCTRKQWKKEALK